MLNKIIKDEILGDLEWKEEWHYWSGVLELFPGHQVKLLVNLKDEKEETALSVCRETLTAIKNKNEELKRQFSGKLVKNYNNNWSEGELIDIETFIKKIKLSDITLYADGKADLFYDCGNLFLGHKIEVNLDKNAVLIEAGLSG